MDKQKYQSKDINTFLKDELKQNKKKNNKGMQSKLPQKYKKENDTTIHTIIIKKQKEKKAS